MRYGHFDTANDEYVIDRPDVPVSFTNYLGSKDYCVVLSHNAGGYSYYRSPQNGRISRFRPNGVPLDRPGHYVYVRDDADGDVWSISWQPVGKPLAADGVPDGARYTAAHGMGYSRFESSYRGIEASQTVFVPLDDALEVWDVRVTNTGDTERTLTLATYVEFSFHTITIDNQNLQMSLYASGSSYADGIIEYDFHYEPWTAHYFASSEKPDSYDSLRDSFLGPYRTESNPIAVERGQGSNQSATTQNHCGSLFHKVTLAPGESRRLVYALGHGTRDEVGRPMQAKYSDLATTDAEFARLRAHWRAKQDALRIRTPHEGMNTMINTWTLLQAETCVQWSRFASFVEVGGRTGLGYRDTAQDVMSVIHSNPVKTRSRIMELLRAQTEAGYGLHLFDPEGVRPGGRAVAGHPVADGRAHACWILADPWAGGHLLGLPPVAGALGGGVRQGDRGHGLPRPGGPVRRGDDGHGVRAPQGGAGLLRGAGRGERRGPGPARGLERLPEPRRRGDLAGDIPARVGDPRVP